MLKLCLGFLVDTLFCVKWLARLSIFIHADILVLNLQWWLVVVGADHCGHIPDHMLLIDVQEDNIVCVVHLANMNWNVMQIGGHLVWR